eukprot:351672-Amphidinium_carterae.1
MTAQFVDQHRVNCTTKVGASCSAALFYPNAPLAHHSLRASCILHRWDFFKPVLVERERACI